LARCSASGVPSPDDMESTYAYKDGNLSSLQEMMLTHPIPLFTTIPPKISRPAADRDFGPAWLSVCARSWSQSGFRPVGINSAEEIQSFRMLTMDFEPTPHPRTRPLIIDMLAAAKASGSRIAGIATADCAIIPQSNLSERLLTLLEGGLVIAERMNISQRDLRPTGQHCFGFDAFFFDVSSLDKIEWDEHFRIGAPWGDYWLPLEFLRAGLQVRTLPAPVLVHLNHEQAWTWTGHRDGFSRLVKLLHQLEPWSSTLPETDEEVLQLVPRIFAWLRTQPVLWSPEYGSGDDLIYSLLNAAASPSPSPYRVIAQQIVSNLRPRSLAARLRAKIMRVS